ncbi:FdhF/YdeP family oxidoreductase [Pseudooceanicola algae]|uniref:Protein YdeP n=1 Tax=Pseudooceanicola algae TaxID=1537215 RepID=A0A418SCW4_9RHOB|nr:FdhF/YdeP family oxidoreductase [Pseudooceanicola algae]QPM92394.1 Protein YdeP [Pseudooceanicola algae]
MSAKDDDPVTHDAADDDRGNQATGIAAGGWGSLKGIARIIGQSEPSAEALRTLYRQNKPGGVMCTACAWAKPGKPHPAEFCENGAKATLWELDKRRANAEFFATHSLTDLRHWHDTDLEKAGRLTDPLRYDPQTDHYVPVTWQEAYADIGARLKALDQPEDAVFYASGHAGLEAAYLYALFARAMGHQNLPQSSNMCHETTSVNLQTFIGTPVGTCTLEDFDHCDAIFFFGQNTGSNSPRFLHTLKDAVDRGCRIVTFNPVRERGLVEFVDPQNVGQMLTGHGTEISEQFYQVRPGGDIAVLVGMMKSVLAAERDAPGTVLDQDFIATETLGYRETIAQVESYGWPEIEEQSGLTRAMIEDASEVYLNAKNVIGIYGMGLTQHVNGWLNLGMLVNLLMLRGNMGRPGAGISPVRGHSNVQGQRTVGIGEKSAHMPADKLKELFGIEAPTRNGLNAVHACEAILEGRVKAMLSLGGNLLRALPDRERMEAAWPQLGLTVNIATKLNRSHLFPGQTGYLLPCLGRLDKDMQAGGAQAVSMEGSLSHVYGSVGEATPPGDAVRSEVAIIAGIAQETLPANPHLEWGAWIDDYALIRDLIARTYPDDFADFNARMFEPGGFYRGNPVRDRIWKTESGKAQFTAPDCLSALGAAPAGEDVLTLITMRSNDQFNTTIYGMSDRLRGLEGERDIVLLNAEEIARLGLKEGDRVTLISAIEDGITRRVPGLKVVPYDLPNSCIAGYYPELNPLVPLSYHEKNSQTPAYKGAPVRLLTEAS